MSVGGRPAIPVAVQREFWAAIRSGMVVAEAASCPACRSRSHGGGSATLAG